MRWAAVFGLLVVAACQPVTALRQYETGAQLAVYDFSEDDTFEEGSYDGAILRIEDGVYHIDVFEGDNAIWWGQAGDALNNTIIEVEVEQVSERNENAFGVMCRVQGSVGQESAIDATLAALMEDATPSPEMTDDPDSEILVEATDESTDEPIDESDAVAAGEATDEVSDDIETVDAEATATSEATSEAEETEMPEATGEVEAEDLPRNNGDGYLFLIQGNGQFAIMRARGRDLFPLVNWTQSEAINQGRARNTLRAICADNYLAFYINDTFVGDATDSSYASGQVGLAASAASRLGTEVTFDNLTVFEAVVPS